MVLPGWKRFRTVRRVKVRPNNRAIARTLRRACSQALLAAQVSPSDRRGRFGALSCSSPYGGANRKRRTLNCVLQPVASGGFGARCCGQPAPYYLTVGGQTYTLQPVSRNPAVLAAARQRNSFLAVGSRKPDHALSRKRNSQPRSRRWAMSGRRSIRKPGHGRWSRLCSCYRHPQCCRLGQT